MNIKDNKNSAQSGLALRTLGLTMLIGPVALLIYAFESKTWTELLMSFGTGLGVIAASVFVGGLLGFLFGIPRTSQQPPPPPPAPPPPSDPASPPSLTPSGLGTGSVAAANTASYQANTNLEQISDWLTKILVGVGLTQVRQIWAKLYELSGGVAWGLSSTHGNNHTFALSLILFYLIAGFLFAYLWTRLFLARALADQDHQLASLTEKVAAVDLRLKDAEANSTGTGKGETEEAQRRLAITEGIAPGNPSDPWKGVFGGQSINNDRQIQAEVKLIPGSAGLFAIRLVVSSLHPQSNPLIGAVQFFLHPTFKNDQPVITVGPTGIAELNTKAWGAFTVGALADDGQTKLELDLAQLATAPPEFRSR